ncbi:MAG TPA: M14 family metallopeptidase [Chitinophagaceae bacterium]|nr:M14 family metallopeptidase [Chitinophagaceae bacterium]
MIKKLTAVIGIFLFAVMAQAQNGYSNYTQQTARINTLAKTYPQLVKVKSIAKTAGGKDTWMLTIGNGNTETKPGIAIVGGVEGNHLLGMEMAIGFAEKLLQASQTDSIKNLLGKTNFYVFPNMSPDAMEQYFAPLQYERQGNASQTDDDRDGKLNEDGYDDLDGNGKITWMRIESPVGDYKTNPDDPRVLIKADLTKGEKGKYLLLPEGIDNDKDGSFNEDGEGGVWFNKNLSFKHPSFTQGAGEFAVSEIETKGLLDNLYQLFNVYAVVSFSANNNLSSPFTYVAANPVPRVVAGYLEQDAKTNAMVADLYNKTNSMKDAPKTNPAGGDFLSWAYYHYGRFSFSTPGWFVPKMKPDTTKKEKAFASEDIQANYLRWATQQGIPAVYTEWKKITHPDFPGQNVEVGGLDPFVLINPPYKLVPEIVKTHTDFIVKLAGYQPELDIINLKTEKLGAGITRITATVINRGALPSHAKLGERSYWVKRINVKLDTEKNQSVISGKKIQLLNALEGYGSRELSWLIKGSGKLILEAGSPTTGSKKMEISL